MMMRIAALCLAAVAYACAQDVPNIKDVLSCPNSIDGRQPYKVRTQTAGDMRKVVIDAPDAVCNDGTKAVMYVRAARPGAMEPDGPSENRWLIHFLGGSSCDTYEECGTRWCGIGQWEGTLMTTAFEGDFRNVDGLFGRNATNRIADRNEVLMKYCSSDQWEGRKSNAVLRSEDDPSKAYSLHFRGATIVDAALAMLEQGVSGLPRLTQATDVLISGDSAGAQGARTHLDRIAERLKAANSTVRVRGNFEATFNPDLNGKQGFPAGDPRDPIYAAKTAEFDRVQVGLRNSTLDSSCLAAHPTAQYLCAEDGYVTLNHITTPFFQIHDVLDPLMIDGLGEAIGATALQIGQGIHDQMQLLPNIRNTAIDRAGMTQDPGVVARVCAQHVTYGDDDGFLGRRIRTGPGATEYSYYELLWNWMTGAPPSVVFGPRPPDTPATPRPDSICGAKAPNAPALPAVVTVSSASYEIGGAVAPESIVATFGTNLAAATATATTTPFPTTLGGLQVQVIDALNVTRLAPLYYVSPGQLLFLIPQGTSAGTARIRIGQQESTVTVAATAPGIYTASQNGKGVAAATYLRITAQGARSEGLLFNPSTGEDSGVPALPGDQIYLILYGTGMRGGAATATVGGVSVPVAGPVDQGQYQGLDQINLGPLPVSIGYGQKQIVIRQGEDLANIVTVTFRRP